MLDEAEASKVSQAIKDEAMLLFAHLMEAGKQDEEKSADLSSLTKLLNEDGERTKQGQESIIPIIDDYCVDTIFGYLDMRQSQNIRLNAILCTAAYLGAAKEEGHRRVNGFFHAKMKGGTYDDYIVAFCAAAAIFSIDYDLMSDLIHTEGFLPSLAPLMSRKWKSRKIETACLEMLHAACMQMKCHPAIQKYCIGWLEEVIFEDPETRVANMRNLVETDIDIDKEGPEPLKEHCRKVRSLAGVIWTKIMAASVQQVAPPNQGPEPKVESAVAKMERLCKRFAGMLAAEDSEDVQYAVEGLAYATTLPKIREQLARDGESLKRIVTVIGSAPPKSPLAYGALSIITHITRYKPTESEEQKRLKQLKAYANAAGKVQPSPLSDDSYVSERCKLVFDAGVTPVLVKHCKTASIASLSLIISIIFSLSVTPSLRGQLAQQGAVRVLIAAWTALPEKEDATRRTAAQALARILISTNPALIFRQLPQTAAIRPLTSIIPPDPNADTRDLLPTFESLLALTNLASTDDDSDTTRRAIVRTAWDDVEEQLFSTNARVSTAAAELVCNLVQSPEEAIGLFGDGSSKAATRVKVMLALADADDVKTRSAAGGALASLTAFGEVVRAVLEQPRGAGIVLGLCRDGDDEGLRHRGAVVVHNMVSQEGEVGQLAREKLLTASGVDALTECAQKSRTPEVVEAVVHALKVLVGEK
ncbi:myosin-binding striated muscle assembly central-domain-containing protein [Chaetomium fimeti]|uniref:Myosin-binding striated muscle assembly central-domain-containing protein n=1 Tax=Chaetomium fimeti TaxID=1854472 RepID=A0AAE0LQ21_9PEZI|nr:myosin-binding striated muscle assembly central-domain-containing protein [Chaetomium fimeti]